VGGHPIDSVDVDGHPAPHAATASPEGPTQFAADLDLVTGSEANGSTANLGRPRRAFDGVDRLSCSPARRRAPRNDDAEGDQVIATGEQPLERLTRDVPRQVN
jgi:hypothetical protein